MRDLAISAPEMFRREEIFRWGNPLNLLHEMVDRRPCPCVSLPWGLYNRGVVRDFPADFCRGCMVDFPRPPVCDTERENSR